MVLRTVKYGDNKLIVDMFTREEGRMSFLVTVPKGSRGKFGKQMFQPLSMLSVECDVRANAQLQKLREVSVMTPFVSIPFDYHKMSMCMFLTEFLCYALRDEQRNESLFDYIIDSVLWLDESRSDYANFHLVFLMRLSMFLGFYPNLDNYEQGDYFDLRNSLFVDHVPLHRDYLMPGEASKILLMMRMNYPTMRLFKMSRQERNRLLDIITYYYRLHFPEFPELKSLEVLREIYSS